MDTAGAGRKAYSKTRGSIKRIINENKYLYLMFLPVLIYYVVFRYVPMLWTIIAFKDYNPYVGIWESSWVGFDYFKQFLSSNSFWRVMRNTLMIGLFDLTFTFSAPVIFALLLNEVTSPKFKKMVSTIGYIPHFISLVVIVSIYMQFLQPNTGLFNLVRQSIGMDSVYFLTEPKYFWGLFTGMNIWRELGWSSIIYLSALTAVDPQLYEAAVVDGAGRFKQMMVVTLPCIAPTIIVLFIIKSGQIFNLGYEAILLMYNSQLYETADVIGTFVYRIGISEGNYSYATAIGLFQAALSLILVMVTNRLSKKFTGRSMW